MFCAPFAALRVALPYFMSLVTRAAHHLRAYIYGARQACSAHAPPCAIVSPLRCRYARRCRHMRVYCYRTCAAIRRLALPLFSMPLSFAYLPPLPYSAPPADSLIALFQIFAIFPSVHIPASPSLILHAYVTFKQTSTPSRQNNARGCQQYTAQAAPTPYATQRRWCKRGVFAVSRDYLLHACVPSRDRPSPVFSFAAIVKI